MPTSKTLTFLPQEFKGSRLRCLLLTHRPMVDVASFLTSLAAPSGIVSVDDHWLPHGFLRSGEAKLDETIGLLSDEDRDLLTRWWLAKPGKANTPNWDLVSTCRVADRQGLLLVEAKAHVGELQNDRCGATDPDNFRRIEQALAEMTTAWNLLEPGFSLTANSHYQLSNRFAFALKLATMRIPVVLVYLGFVNATEMKGRHLLRDHAHWQASVLSRSRGVVPPAAWNRTFNVNGTPLTILVRTAEIQVEAKLITLEGNT